MDGFIRLNKQLEADSLETKKFLKQFWKLVAADLPQFNKNVKDATNLFSGLLASYYLCNEVDTELVTAFNEYFITHWEEMSPKEVILILRPLLFEAEFTFYSKDLLNLIQQFLEEKMASIEVMDIWSLLEIIEKSKKLEKREILTGLTSSLDLYIQTNPKKYDVILKILEKLEDSHQITKEFATQKKALIHKIQF